MFEPTINRAAHRCIIAEVTIFEKFKSSIVNICVRLPTRTWAFIGPLLTFAEDARDLSGDVAGGDQVALQRLAEGRRRTQLVPAATAAIVDGAGRHRGRRRGRGERRERLQRHVHQRLDLGERLLDVASLHDLLDGSGPKPRSQRIIIILYLNLVETWPSSFVRSFNFVRLFDRSFNLQLPQFTRRSLVIFRPWTFYPCTTWKYTVVSLYSPPKRGFCIAVGHMKRTC